MIEKKSAQQRREHTQNTLQKSDITQKKLWIDTFTHVHGNSPTKYSSSQIRLQVQ